MEPAMPIKEPLFYAHQIGQCKTNDALACFFIIIYKYIYIF